MKIGIVGTHGVGKSTVVGLLYNLLQKRGNTIIISEISRIAEQQRLPINEETTLYSQEAIQYIQRAEEIVAEHKLKEGKCRYIVCDRTVFDNYVYMERAFGAQEHFIEAAKKWLREHPYTHIFKVPIWFNSIKADKVRSTAVEFQRDIDGRIDTFFKELGVSYHIIPVGCLRQANEAEQFKALSLYFIEKLGLDNVNIA